MVCTMVWCTMMYVCTMVYVCTMPMADLGLILRLLLSFLVPFYFPFGPSLRGLIVPFSCRQERNYCRTLLLPVFLLLLWRKKKEQEKVTCTLDCNVW